MGFCGLLWSKVRRLEWGQQALGDEVSDRNKDSLRNTLHVIFIFRKEPGHILPMT